MAAAGYFGGRHEMQDFLVKAAVKECERPQAVSTIRFGLMSGKEIVQASHLPVVSRQLYSLPQRTPVRWGVLDPRLGAAKEIDPVGRFGHIELALPVFHIGFFKATIATMQCICKTCSRVLLSEPMRSRMLKRMRAPGADALRKVKLRKLIIAACKKTRVCPFCKSSNAQVKRVPGAPSFRIVHDVHKLGDAHTDALRASVAEAARLNPEVKAHTDDGAAEVLTPVRCLRLLRAVPDADSDLLWVDSRVGRPDSLILTHLAVPPLCIRPSVAMDAGGGSNEDDLTVKLQEIVGINVALRVAIDRGAAPRALAECWDLLQVEVGAYINGELPGLPPAMRPRRPIRALCQRLKGKQGRFRGNLSGKRVDFSARTVISPDPNLPVHCVAVPQRVAKILTFPERVTSHNLERMKRLVGNGGTYPGANFVRSADGRIMALAFASRERAVERLRVGDVVERHLQDDDVVLFNRQPSLHKMSIMAHRARVRPWRTFRFNECVCSPYNADFDGDEMNMHLPQTEEARAEAGLLMDVRENLVTPRSGEPLVAACQDFITASFLLTQRNIFLSEAQIMQAAAALGEAEEEISLPEPAVIHPARLWTGKQLFGLLMAPGQRKGSRAATMAITIQFKARNYSGKRGETWPGAARGHPDPWGGAAPAVGDDWGALDPDEGWVVIRGGDLMCGNLCKSALGSNKKGVIHALVRDIDGRAAARCMLRLTRMCTRWLTEYGFSIGIEDVMPSRAVAGRKDDMVGEGYDKCADNIGLFRRGQMPLQPGCNEEESLEAALNGILGKLRDTIGSMCVRELPFHNAPRVMAACGSKGSTLNICQMVACVGQQAVGGSRIPEGFVSRTLPIFLPFSKEPNAKGFVANSFFTGLTATEFFFHTMGGREGLVDTAVKTAETGYMQRRMMKALEDLSVQYDDTVRTSAGDVVQFRYGDDSLDPSRMMASGRPVEFEKLLLTVRVRDPDWGCEGMLPREVDATVDAILMSGPWRRILAADTRAVEVGAPARSGSGSSSSSSSSGNAASGAGAMFVAEVRAFTAGLSDAMRTQRRDLGLLPDDDAPTSLPPPPGMGGADDVCIGAASSSGAGGAGSSARSRLAQLRRLSPAARAVYLRGHAAVLAEAASALEASASGPPEDPLFGEVILASAFRVTPAQVASLLEEALRRFELAHIQPGEAVGALAAHSMGEPATQMTLKTFHFAGVASMNVTLGVPRIKEIINASKNISTPILEAALQTNDSEVAARFVKGRIEKTTLGELARTITEVHTQTSSHLEVRLDLRAIQKLQLEVDVGSVARAISEAPKLNLKDSVSMGGDDIIIVKAPGLKKTSGRRKPPKHAGLLVPADMTDTHSRGKAHLSLQSLKTRLPGIIVCGIPTVSRAVITEDETATKAAGGKRRFQLLVEGEGLLEVMGTPGIEPRHTKSNHIAEVERVLGIEAARVMIMRELEKTYGSYGIDIDPRHLMLLADVMTYRGEVLGITRFGIAKMKDSVVMLASFEKTPDHLFDAAVHSRQDHIKGVSECIVVGRPCGLGTGAFKLGLDVHGIGRKTSLAASRAGPAATSDVTEATAIDPAQLRSALRRRSTSVASESDFGPTSASLAGTNPSGAAPPTFSLGALPCSLLPRPPVPIMAPWAAGACPNSASTITRPGQDDDVLLDLAGSRAGLGLRSSSASSSASSAAGGPEVPRRVALSASHLQRPRSLSSSSASALPAPSIPEVGVDSGDGGDEPRHAGHRTRRSGSGASSVGGTGHDADDDGTDGGGGGGGGGLGGGGPAGAAAAMSGFGSPVVVTAASLEASAAAAAAMAAVRSDPGSAAAGKRGKAGRMGAKSSSSHAGDESANDDAEEDDDDGASSTGAAVASDDASHHAKAPTRRRRAPAPEPNRPRRSGTRRRGAIADSSDEEDDDDADADADHDVKEEEDEPVAARGRTKRARASRAASVASDASSSASSAAAVEERPSRRGRAAASKRR